MIHKPNPDEYPPYYNRYINLIPDDNILIRLDSQKLAMSDLLSGIGEEAANYRYEPEKWSIKEVIGHVIDVERIFVYRALRFARDDKTSLPEFNQDDYVKQANFDGRTLINLADEFNAVRESTYTLFAGFSPDFFDREGMASGFRFTVRSIPFIIAGHELHHRQIIQSKYLRK